MRMPISPAVLQLDALSGFVERVQSGALPEYKLVGWDAPLWWLGDAIPIPWGVPGMASAGDLFMSAGIFVWTQGMMLRGRRERAPHGSSTR